MRPVFSAAGAQAADRALIDGQGIPGIVLMRKAAQGLADVVMSRCGVAAQQGVAVVCGPGNNGGDGYGAARLLHAQGVPVWVWPCSDASPGDAGTERDAARRAGVPERCTLGGAGVVVDAVFGTGLARPVTGALAEVIGAVAAFEGQVIAADLPSGLCGDTGRVLGVAARADVTVTFGGLKQGMFTGQGPALVGEVVCVPLGFDPSLRQASRIEPADVAGLWPWRPPDAHKGTSGHLLLVAGSAPMAGASVLACRGALAAGAGLVTLVSPRGAWSRLGSLPPEVMVIPGGQGDDWDGTLPELARFDALVVGPGLGRTTRHGAARAALAHLHATWSGPMVLDADGLQRFPGPAAGPRVLTPHEGEAARWLERTRDEVAADRMAAARALAAEGAVALLKGPYTLVAQQGAPVAIIGDPCPVLASGGTGDVLAGVVGALLARFAARGTPQARDAALLGAWVHGDAARRLAQRRREGWTASDVAAAIPEAVEALRTDHHGLP